MLFGKPNLHRGSDVAHYKNASYLMCAHALGIITFYSFSSQ